MSKYVKALSKMGVEVTVFLPSHGRHLSEDFRRAFNLRHLEWFKVRGFRRGVDGRQYWYFIGAEEGFIDNIRFIMFKGLDYDTGRYLDQWDIYSELPEKASLYARALKHWVDLTGDVPDLIHSNDWTSGLAGVLLKVYLESRGWAVPYVHSLHLLSSPSFPWHYASSDWSGIDDVLHRLWVGHRHELRSVKSVWDSVYGNVDHFTALEADALAFTSYGYLNEVLDKFGRWLEPKSCIVHNVTDWSVGEVRELASRYFNTDVRSILKYYVIDYMNNANVGKYGYLRDIKLLTISSGRLTAQKGFDMLIKALSNMDRDIGLLVCGISVGDAEFERRIKELANLFPGRVLILFNQMPLDIVKIAVYSSNVFVVPSRYEPFGMVSIEAQAVGTPVVVSNVGGLPETVLDLRRSIEGSGLIVDVWNEWELSKAVESLAYITESEDSGNRDLVWRVSIDWLRDLALRGDVHIRLNAIKWVNSRFREDSLVKELTACYEKARLYAYYRSIS